VFWLALACVIVILRRLVPSCLDPLPLGWPPPPPTMTTRLSPQPLSFAFKPMV